MKVPAAAIDTNVVVAGLLTRDPDAPTAQILDAMLRGGFPFLLSMALLAEYRAVLLRRRIRALHGLDERQVDALLVVIAAHGIVREPLPTTGAPDPKDDHLWSLVASQPGSVLVTGDAALARKPPAGNTVLNPREFLIRLAG